MRAASHAFLAAAAHLVNQRLVLRGISMTAAGPSADVLFALARLVRLLIVAVHEFIDECSTAARARFAVRSGA